MIFQDGKALIFRIFRVQKHFFSFLTKNYNLATEEPPGNTFRIYIYFMRLSLIRMKENLFSRFPSLENVFSIS